MSEENTIKILAQRIALGGEVHPDHNPLHIAAAEVFLREWKPLPDRHEFSVQILCPSTDQDDDSSE